VVAENTGPASSDNATSSGVSSRPARTRALRRCECLSAVAREQPGPPPILSRRHAGRHWRRSGLSAELFAQQCHDAVARDITTVAAAPRLVLDQSLVQVFLTNDHPVRNTD